MSHYTCLVVTDDFDDESLAKALQPFHEYECTGIKDEYVKFVDETEEAESYWRQYQNKEISQSVEYDSKEHFLREYGYIEANGAWGRFTNPDKKWDWWTPGGRWQGHLLLESGDRVDSSRRGNVDLDGALAEAMVEHDAEYHAAHKIIAGRDWLTWSQIIGDSPIVDDAMRDKYHSQQVVIDLRAGTKGFTHYLLDMIDDLKQPKYEYVASKAARDVSTYAVLKDGVWHARGDMGWWGISSNEKDNWPATWMELWNSIPADKVVTVVDCHI